MELQSNQSVSLKILNSITREIEDIAANIDSYRAIVLDYPGKPTQLTLKQDLRDDFREFVKREDIAVPRSGINSALGFQCYMKYRWKLNKISSLHLPNDYVSDDIRSPLWPVYLTCDDDMVYMLKLKCPNLTIKIYSIALVNAYKL